MWILFLSSSHTYTLSSLSFFLPPMIRRRMMMRRRNNLRRRERYVCVCAIHSMRILFLSSSHTYTLSSLSFFYPQSSSYLNMEKTKKRKVCYEASLCIVPIVYLLVYLKMPYHYYPDISFHTLPRHRAFKGENGSANVSISLYFSYHLSFIVSHKILILYIVIPTYHFTSVEVE